MSKYNIHATKQDWQNLYEAAERNGLDVKLFKKSQSFDMSTYYFYSEVAHRTGKKLGEVMKDKMIYCYDNTIKMSTN